MNLTLVRLRLSAVYGQTPPSGNFRRRRTVPEGVWYDPDVGNLCFVGVC
jgi:hypothetical protein